MTRKAPILFLCLAALVTLIYSNHFGNDFHFDDFHTIVQNPYIRDIHNLPKFFVDTETTSVLPANRTWRPLLFASLAVDYWLGNAMKPFYFHLSTFLWFLVLLGLMFALFRKIVGLWTALFATALFAVHPVVAETVNYIIQRSDLYSTLGVVASLATWIYLPGARKFGLYLLPLAAAILSKPQALVFPLILFLYLWLLEGEEPRAALRLSIPAVVTVIALAWLSSAMTPKTFTPGAASAYSYRITQPIVIFRYFRTFFLPTALSADTDRVAFDSIFDGDALFGFVFVLGLVYAGVKATRRKDTSDGSQRKSDHAVPSLTVGVRSEVPRIPNPDLTFSQRHATRPIAFGLFWFLLALLPTSIFPLAEVENDHRMFFPFVGLALSAATAVAVWLEARPARRNVTVGACVVALLIFAAGTWQRNKIWHTEESLWYDVTLKSPHNGRGLMNYALTQMSKGDTARALGYFQRALVYNPNYYVLEVNLGVAYGDLRNDAEAERHFARAIQLAPNEAVPHYYYAVWLRGRGRLPEAIQQLNTVIATNPSYVDASHQLMDIYGEMMDANGLRKTATETLARFPADAAAAGWLARAGSLRPSADGYLNQSMMLYQQGKFEASRQAAREALKLRPDYSDAWNNIAAAFNAEAKWDEGIKAAQEAVRLRPDNQLAKNNLAWAIQQKQKAGGR